MSQTGSGTWPRSQSADCQRENIRTLSTPPIYVRTRRKPSLRPILPVLVTIDGRLLHYGLRYELYSGPNFGQPHVHNTVAQKLKGTTRIAICYENSRHMETTAPRDACLLESITQTQNSLRICQPRPAPDGKILHQAYNARKRPAAPVDNNRFFNEKDQERSLAVSTKIAKRGAVHVHLIITKFAKFSSY